jgi:hypothetical protein
MYHKFVKRKTKPTLNNNFYNSQNGIECKHSNIDYVTNLDFTNNNPDMNNYNDILINREIGNINNEGKLRCYISLTTHPGRFYSDDFINVLKCLCKQTVSPDKIFVSVCFRYVRKFNSIKSDTEISKRIDFIHERFPLVKIIRVNDRGPATKLLGLLEYNNEANILSENDLIIIVDDDTLYSRDLVHSHFMCYQIYNCDVIAVDENMIIKTWEPYTFNESDILYQDSYKGFLYGWLSFSVTFRSMKIKNDIEQFYSEIVSKFPDVFYHDDLLFTLYTQQNKLYTVENRFIPLLHNTIENEIFKIDSLLIKRNITNDARTKIDSVDALRNTPMPSNISRKELENEVYAYHGFRISDKSFYFRNIDYIIQKEIPERDLFLIDGLRLVNSPEDIHVSFVFIDDKNALLTVTVFDNSLMGTQKEILFSINNKTYSIIIDVNSNKFSHIIHFNEEFLRPKKHNNMQNHTVIQTYSKTNVTRNKFYSIGTVLNASFEFPYVFFDDYDLFNFIEDNFSNIVTRALKNLIPGAYISDVFRYAYLYLNGGVYIDCKKIIIEPLSDYINNVINQVGSYDIFVKDCLYNYCYNAIIVCDKLSKVMKYALASSIFKIVKNVYDKDPLSLTGPGCLGDAIDYIYEDTYPYYYYNVIPIKNQDWLSYISDGMNRVVKNTYFGYYNEGKYRTTGHYHHLWHNKKVYKRDLSNEYVHIRKIMDIKLFK